eukprot:s3069_g12.t1
MPRFRMQHLSDDVLVTGGSQTIFSYRSIFTSLPVADMTWMGVVLFASGVAKLDFEMLVVGFAHSESLPSAKSSAQLGFFFSSKPVSSGLALLVLDNSFLGAALLCRSLACLDPVASALGSSRIGLVATVLDFSRSALFPIAHGNMDTSMLAFDLVQSDSLLLLGLKKPFEPLLAVGGLTQLAVLMLLHAFQHLGSLLFSCLRSAVGEMDATELRLGHAMSVSGFARTDLSFLVLRNVQFDFALFLRGTGHSALPCVVLDSSQLGLPPVLRSTCLGFPTVLMGKARVSSALSVLKLAHCEVTMPLQAANCLDSSPFTVNSASLGVSLLLKGVPQPELFLPAGKISIVEVFLLVQGMV